MGSAPREEEAKPEPVAKPQGSFGKKAEEKKKRDVSGLRGKKAPPPSRKAVVEEDEVRINPLNKGKRAQLDSRNKYPINEVKGDHVERL